MGLRRIWLTIAMVLGAMAIGGCGPDKHNGNVVLAGRHLNEALAVFTSRLDRESWDRLLKVAQGDESADAKCIILTARYCDEALKRDLPNSMALSGITPGQKVREQKRVLKGLTEQLKVYQVESLWKLLGALASQQWDRPMRIYGLEIALLLSHERYVRLRHSLLIKFGNDPEFLDDIEGLELNN